MNDIWIAISTNDEVRDAPNTGAVTVDVTVVVACVFAAVGRVIVEHGIGSSRGPRTVGRHVPADDHA